MRAVHGESVARMVETRDRGRITVWDTAGPVGAPTLVLLHGVTLDAKSNFAAAVPPSPSTTACWRSTCAGTARAPGARALPAGRLCGRRRRRGPRAAGRTGRSRRLLDGRDGRPGVLAAAPGAGRGPRALRDRPQRLGLAVRAAHRHDDALRGRRGRPRSRRCSRSAADLVGAACSATASTTASAAPCWTGCAALRWSPRCAAMQAVCDFSSHRWISGVDVPTAVIVTRHDRVVPPSRQWRLARALPDRGGVRGRRRPRRLPRRARRLRPRAGRGLPGGRRARRRGRGHRTRRLSARSPVRSDDLPRGGNAALHRHDPGCMSGERAKRANQCHSARALSRIPLGRPSEARECGG